MDYIWDEITSAKSYQLRKAKRLWSVYIRGRGHAILLKIGHDDQWYADFEQSKDSVWLHLPDVTSLEQAKAAVELMARMGG